MTGEWKLVERECTDGICLTIWHTGRDSKLGSLSLDHKNIGEAIVDELNRLEDKVLNIDAYVESVEEANEWLKTVHKDLKRENNQLKTQLDNCLNKKLFSRRELERENKELKQRISEAKSMEFQILYRDIENLKREKEELKYHLDKTEKELQEYKDFMSLG